LATGAIGDAYAETITGRALKNYVKAAGIIKK
jgi:hypothetical protein